MTLHAAIDGFLTHLAVERGLAASTIEAYGRDLGALVDSIGEGEVQAIDASALRRHFTRLEACGQAASTRARARSAVSSFLTYLHAEGQLTTDPLAQIGRPPQRRRVPYVLSQEEVGSLIRAPDDSPLGIRDRALLDGPWFHTRSLGQPRAKRLGKIGPAVRIEDAATVKPPV